jgi:hypothetical protein
VDVAEVVAVEAVTMKMSQDADAGIVINSPIKSKLINQY